MTRKFNVTYYSNWDQPQVFRNVTQQKADELYIDGRMMKYRVVVTEIHPGTEDAIQEHTGSSLD
jgi:hypothetical protein